MRMHIDLDEDLVREIDRLAGPRERTAFVRKALTTAVTEARRAEALARVAGSLAQAAPHEWDADPAQWVRETRRSGVRRAG